MAVTLHTLWRQGFLLQEDYALASRYIFDHREPDVVIAPDGSPYLYRWHVAPRNDTANVYLHLQVADDPERPLHDHPWDNTSVILAGGYVERLQRNPAKDSRLLTLRREPGDVIHRKAEEAHRLFLPVGRTYTLTLFATGPHRRAWGFWLQDPTRWVDAQECIETLADGRSVWNGPKAA